VPEVEPESAVAVGSAEAGPVVEVAVEPGAVVVVEPGSVVAVAGG